MTPATRKKLHALVADLADPEIDDQSTKKKLRKLLEGGSADLQIEKANASIDLALASKRFSVRAPVGYIAGPLLARHLRRGEELTPRVDELLGLGGIVPELRLMYARIPKKRRTRIWERELAYWAEQVENREWGRFLVGRFEENLIDVAPEAKPFIAAYHAAVPPPEAEPYTRRLFPANDPNAPYVFADPWIVNADAWEDFDDGERKQLMLATERMTGKKVRSVTAIARANDPDFKDEFELRFWSVYRKDPRDDDAPVFDCWVFHVDNAVFFEHATTKRVRVYVLQDSFMEDDDEPASAKLAADLAASAPKSLWLT